MADTKLTGLTELTDPTLDDLVYVVDDPGGTPAGRKTTVQNFKDVHVIDSGSVSSAGNLDITDIPSWARKVEIEFDNFQPATDDVQARIRTSSDNGSSFDSGSTDYALARIAFRVGGSIATGGSNGTDGILFGGAAERMGNAAGEIARGRIILNNPGDSGQKTGIEAEIHYTGLLGDYSQQLTRGERISAEANDAIRIDFDSGNIATMNYTVFAHRKS